MMVTPADEGSNETESLPALASPTNRVPSERCAGCRTVPVGMGPGHRGLWARPGSNRRPLACKQGSPERCADLHLRPTMPSVPVSVERSLLDRVPEIPATLRSLAFCADPLDAPDGRLDGYV